MYFIWVCKFTNNFPYSKTFSCEKGQFNVTSGNKIQLGYGLIDAEAGMRYLLDTLIPSCIDGISTTEQAEEAKATKKLCNGKIIIEKNGIRYNTVGQITK